MRIIENSLNNYRIVNSDGKGIATFYTRKLAEQYLDLLLEYKNEVKYVMEDQFESKGIMGKDFGCPGDLLV